MTIETKIFGNIELSLNDLTVLRAISENNESYRLAVRDYESLAHLARCGLVESTIRHSRLVHSLTVEGRDINKAALRREIIRLITDTQYKILCWLITGYVEFESNHEEKNWHKIVTGELEELRNLSLLDIEVKKGQVSYSVTDLGREVVC